MKAVIYVRVSSKEQEREGYSIPAQKKLLSEYALANQINVVRVFEEAESAKVAGRTQFKAMLSFLIENPEIKLVLVEKTDRLYRNNRDYVDLDPETGNLEIHLVKEGQILSKNSPAQLKFVHGMKVQMAKFYSDNLSEEVIKGQVQKASEGLWPSCAPVGYKNKLDDHTIIPDPQNAPFIQRAFQLASTGQYSLARLGQALFNQGLRSVRANSKLGKSALVRILTNPIYYGDFDWGGRRYLGKHEPLITKALFDRVQEAMGFAQKPRLTKRDFPFRGLMTCGHCGCTITAEQKRKKSGRTYTYYHCTNGKGGCSSVAYLPEDRLDEAFSRALASNQAFGRSRHLDPPGAFGKLPRGAGLPPLLPGGLQRPVRQARWVHQPGLRG